MPYVPGSRYDLFVSYAHVDNEPGTDSRGWVSDFHDCLVRTIRQRLGQDADEFKVFFDPVVRANQELPELLVAAKESALFLGVGSPSWATRDFCKKELAAFSGAAADNSRIFVAEYMPLGDGLDWPEQVCEKIRPPFHKKSSVGDIRIPLDGTIDKQLYLERIHGLAGDIVEELRALRSADGASPAGAARPAPALKPDGNPITVLIAEPTDDLVASAATLGPHLQQFGIRPLIAPQSYLGGKEFAQQFAAMLEEADLFVQLLGPFGGKRPPELPQGFTAFQAEAALKAGKPVLQWRRPDLDLGQVDDPDHCELLQGKDVVSSTLEDFKARATEAALKFKDKPEAAKAKPKTGALPWVFVDADPVDGDAAQRFEKELAQHGVRFLDRPSSEAAAERMKVLERGLVECDVLVCIYGSTQSRWVRAQLKLLDRFAHMRESDLQVLAVCTGPPRPKEAVGVRYPGLHEVDCGEDWDVEPIRKLILELNQ